MDKRPLGRSGLSIAPLMLGGNVFGWTLDEPASFKVLDAFVDAGFEAIDTADVYSAWIPGNKGGDSETVLGNWFKTNGKRDRVMLATKCGMKMPEGGEGLSRDWIVRAVEDSLRRLQTDRIDLYQAHKDDPSTPLDETLEAFDRLVKDGKVRAIGGSNYEAPRLAAALDLSDVKGWARYETLQPLYNLMDRGFEEELQQMCVDREVGVIPFYGLAAGFLTGKYRSEADLSKSPRGKNVGAKYLNPRGLKVLGALDTVAAELNATPAQVALAWLMSRPAVTAPIASATSVEQLDELAGAVRLKLTGEAIAALDAASA